MNEQGAIDRAPVVAYGIESLKRESALSPILRQTQSIGLSLQRRSPEHCAICASSILRRRTPTHRLSARLHLS
jgi:hypothetical protein